MQTTGHIADQIGIGLEIEHIERTTAQPTVNSGHAGLRTGHRPRTTALGQRCTHHRLAGRNLRQPVGLLRGAAGEHQCGRHHDGVGDKGHRRDPVAKRFRSHAGIERAKPHATVFGRDDQTRQADFIQPGDHIRRTAFVFLGKAANPIKGRPLAQIGIEAVLEQDLFRRQSEFHQAAPAVLGSRGRPRPRSAMMFFWIWLVPPPMIRPR